MNVITPSSTQPSTNAHQVQGMDSAAAEAERRFARPKKIAWTAVLVGVVAIVAFVAGRQFASGPGSKSPASSAHSSVAGASSQPAAGAAQLWTCSMHPQVIQPDPGICPICHMELTPLKADGSAAAGGVITIDPVVVQNMGVRVAQVTRGPIMQSVRVVGYLEEPEPLHRDINLRVNGWIEKLHANIDGMVITKDQPLFDLYSPELTVAIDELIAARRQAASVIDNSSGKTLVDTSQRKLAQFGLTSEQIDSFGRLDTAPATVPILAPIDGHLTVKMVYEGAAVKAGDLVMRIANRHLMWIDAQVPESQMSLVSNGQPVRARLVSQPGKTYTGKVLFVHPHLDAQTRTALVRIEIANQDLALRQGMYATVEILADAYREALVIPNEAVIDSGRRQLVFVSLGEGRFAPRDVTLGLPGQDGTVEVAVGLADGDAVVTSGQFLLDSESRLKEAVAKHLSGGLPGHSGHESTPGMRANTDSALPASQPAAMERIAIPHADDMVREYLTLAQKLGARQEAETPVDADALIRTATLASEHATGDAAALPKKLAEAAAKLRDQPIAEQRKAFVAVSDAAIELARRAKLSQNPLLYVMHCPMAFEDKGAHWMQREEELANPYYATQMKRCGEVIERLEVK